MSSRHQEAKSSEIFAEKIEGDRIIEAKR